MEVQPEAPRPGDPLRGSEERYRLLVAGVRDYAIFLLDPQGNVASWNTGAEQITGYRPDEIIGRHFSIFYIGGAIRAGKPDAELRVAAAEGRFKEDDWLVRKDASLFWANVLLAALRDDEGRLVGFSAVIRDLTERRQAQEKLRQSEERYRRLVESVEDYAIYLLDPDGHVLTWNTGAERIKGYTAGEIVGRHFSVFYPPEDVAQGKPERGLRLATTEGRFEDESWRLRKDGSRFCAHVVLTALYDPEGNLSGFAKVTHDLTKRLRAEEQARQLDREQAARAEAEAASRRKDQFLAMLAHELRNPLAPMLTGLTLLRRPGVPGETRERALDVLERQILHMSRMVDDLLDASRVARGLVQLHRERLDFARLVRTACEDRRPVTELAGRTLTVTTPETPAWVNGDRTRLTQVVTNLLDNGHKFTERGGHIHVVLRTDAAAQRAVLSVSDNGIGIEADMLPHIFDALAQADRTLARSRGGLGLGLTVVRALVELHGGAVRAASGGRGQGSEFTVHLALESEPAALSAAPRVSTAIGRRRRVLVIEDHRDAAESLRLLLEIMGHEVAVTYTGTDGVREALRWQPEVVLSDIGLPGLNGLEVAAELRRHGATRTARLVALSGYGSEEDRSRSRQAGFDFHLCKPADPNELQTIIQEAAGG
jgi:PAS domain S-box-containing protein